ncbi:unnamed protein product [Cylicocyclus nassatus]|uniref:Polypeptide N-acetylgalactosaminyltransferase n=1 Tax=Cylicocyclus nassatus TaxID=53992 RepID=A0AA36M5I4_CYLNA|nr:unnamed protein product [Cylicocyclus nassatus]
MYTQLCKALCRDICVCSLSKNLNTESRFNVMASEMISVNRSLPDYRNNECQDQTYRTENLPKTSIIIVFHNEAWSTLLRTLHSVINRSPLNLLEEIILIDDLSDRDYLKEPLDAYIKRFPIPMRIVHLKKRSGLIRARLTGSGMARGRILLFLDAHVEVTHGWLEPLVDRVVGDRKRVVAPIIDVISDDTFEYVTASETTWGGFNWHLNFRWYPVAKREISRRRGLRASPIQTPTIAGGLFAIDKQFFYDIGSYDEGMQVWGGENLEISFRVWMCGGSLEIHPCSRVGHVFRKQTPYTFPGGTAKVIHHNAARTAEVWMDKYKQFFYKMVPSARHVDPGDLTSRRQLRADLQCKDFEWYLRNIYPEAPLPYDFISLGAISNPASRGCIDTMAKKEGPVVETLPCFKDGRLIHVKSGQCVSAATNEVELRNCDNTPSQQKIIFYTQVESFSKMARARESKGRAFTRTSSTAKLHKNSHRNVSNAGKAARRTLESFGCEVLWRVWEKQNARSSTECLFVFLPKKDRADMTRQDTGALPIDLLTAHTQMRYVDHSFDNIRRYKRYQHFQHLQYDQRMIPERLLFLGPDLAAAHFLVHRGASVKFLGDDAWYRKDKNGNYKLPGRKIPGLYIEAIDASGTELMFEGLENLQNLKNLRMLRLADCPYVDDWTLSRIGGMMENLEMLDLSGCHRISAKGLMGLKMLKSLKYLRLEGVETKNFDYEHELEMLEADIRLLQNPSVIEDAKGNMFAEDENGRLFYINGNVNERPVVDDNDKPIVTSTIRREIPAMSDEEFDKIDRLSGGKLRHLLLGSPSGYEWNSQVETILQFEADYNEKRGIPTNTKMLPKEKREKFPDKEKPSLLEAERLKFLSEENEEWKQLERKLLTDKDHAAEMQKLASDEEPKQKAQKGGVS